jgi:hypothetical protein
MMVTREALLAGRSDTVPAAESAWMLGSMYANGHSTVALAARMRVSYSDVGDVIKRRKRTTGRVFYRKAVELFDERGRIPGPTDGLADLCRLSAADLGYRLPDAYAPDGTLWSDAVNEQANPGLAERDREATDRLEVLRLSLRYLLTSTQIIMRMHPEVTPPGADEEPSPEWVVYRDQVRRYRNQAGVKFKKPKSFVPGFENHTALLPGFEKRAADILAVLDRWEADPLGDPYRYCVELGTMRDKRFPVLDRPAEYGGLRSARRATRAA